MTGAGTPIDAVVRLVASHGLSPAVGADPDAPPPAPPAAPEDPLDQPTWTALLRRVERGRLAGFLQAAIDAGALPVTDDQRSQAADTHLRWCAAVLALEHALLEAVGHLEAAGIDPVVLKGAAHAHLIYPDPSWRLFGDTDLLVPADAFDDAVTVLAELGYERPVPEARPGFDARFGKGATLRRDRGERGRQELDLHRTLVFGTFGFAIDTAELFRSATTFQLGGRELRALGPDTRLLHACYHAALGDPDPRPASIRDIAQQLAVGTHDPGRVVELVHAWRAEAVVQRGLALCRTHLGVRADGPVADAVASHRPTRRELRAIASYVGPNRRFAAKVRASLPYLDGVGQKAAFVRALAFPSRRFAEVRGARPGLAWLRRGTRGLIGRPTRRRR